MTWLQCSDRNWFVDCEIFRAGMENKQILDGLCQDNGIIQSENGRGQFSHNHVSCLSHLFSLSASLHPNLSFPFTRSVIWTQTHTHTQAPFSLYRSVLLLFSSNSWCGNVERNLHRKQSPIRIALFMSKHCAAYKKRRECMNKKEVSWVGTQWQHAQICICTQVRMHR